MCSSDAVSIIQVRIADVAYGYDKQSRQNLEREVENHIYPPGFWFVLHYTSHPDCSRGALKTKLLIEGDKMGTISFPITVYEMKSK